MGIRRLRSGHEQPRRRTRQSRPVEEALPRLAWSKIGSRTPSFDRHALRFDPLQKKPGWDALPKKVQWISTSSTLMVESPYAKRGKAVVPAQFSDCASPPTLALHLISRDLVLRRWLPAPPVILQSQQGGAYGVGMVGSPGFSSTASRFVPASGDSFASRGGHPPPASDADPPDIRSQERARRQTLGRRTL
jgi:hypothetical protein